MNVLKQFNICKHTDFLEPGMWFLCQDEQYLGKALLKNPFGVICSPEVAPLLTCPYTLTQDPYRTWSDMCALQWPSRPGFVAGVTGTNGKTSVAYITYQLLCKLGISAAYIGTLGVHSHFKSSYNLRLTTPDAFDLHRILHELSQNATTHLAIEISSIALTQKRVANLHLDVAAFTSFSQDHLDLHKDMNTYWAAKMEIVDILKPTGIFLVERELSHRINFSHTVYNSSYTYTSPLYVGFMQDNLQAAGSICQAAGFTQAQIQAAIDSISERVPGRLEEVLPNVFIDFAHNPESLQRLLQCFAGKRIVLVFGCGGNRDQGKRVLMGEIARKYSEVVIITDDNPRQEEPKLIREQIICGCPSAIDIPNRCAAIREGIRISRSIDGVCIIAGKGHETVQIYGNSESHFSDREEVMRWI